MVHWYSRLKKLAHGVLKVGHPRMLVKFICNTVFVGSFTTANGEELFKQVVIRTMRLSQARKQKQNLANLPSPKQTGTRTTIIPLQRFMHNIEYSPKEKMLSVFISVPSKKVLHWANVCFSDHEYFKPESTEFQMNYKLCELLETV